MKLQRLLSYVRRATEDYNMINEGDKIAVGVSGGKDSLALLIALSEMRRFYPVKYEVNAITISLGFDDMDFSSVKELCNKLNINYYIVKTDIGEIIFEERKESNPCSLCSKMRKGALHDEAKRLGYNKIALGHNRDDVIETFFMSLFFEGRIHSFSPVTYLDRKELFSIRPLIYTPECEIKSFVKKEQMKIVKNACPVDGHTTRETIKAFITEQNHKYNHFDEKIFGAITRSSIKGWNETLT